MVKPDHVKFAKQIFAELDKYGKRIFDSEVKSVPRDVIAEHYGVHKGKHFYEMLVRSFVGKPVAIAVYEGDDVIRKFRDVVGVTDPSKASKDTIRGKYGSDSKELAEKENRPIKNVIHASDSFSEAKREISLWKPLFDS